MTLIIGIKCSDGVVLGADGAATFGSLGRETIRQPVTRKLEILGGRIVVGVSGPAGLGQRFRGEIEALWDNRGFVAKSSLPTKANADPFLAFVRRIFWPKRLPTVDEATFTTLWTLSQAIETAPAHVGEPKQIVVLEKLGTQCLARELGPDDFEEHLVAIGEAESALARFKDGAVKIQAPPEP